MTHPGPPAGGGLGRLRNRPGGGIARWMGVAVFSGWSSHCSTYDSPRRLGCRMARLGLMRHTFRITAHLSASASRSMLLPLGSGADAFGHFQELGYAVPVSAGVEELERLVDVGPLQCRTPLAAREINVKLSPGEAQLIGRALDGKQLVARFRSGTGSEKGD